MQHEIKLGLERVSQLLELLDNPQNHLKYVHVAGTNGKGSTCAFLSNIFVTAGLKTGLFTSPYIISSTEMLQINNTEIAQEDFDTLLQEVEAKTVAMDDKPSEFEVYTAAALLHFYRQKCDIVVLEVGMGGRLDATNVIPMPEVAVITAIGIDHTEYLGNTIDKIAAEKAGIIKRGTICVTYPQSKTIDNVIAAKCVRNGVKLAKVADILTKEMSQVQLPLHGSHQAINASLAITAVVMMMARGWNIQKEAVSRGIFTTKWRWRFETLRHNPTFIVDAAHNVQSAEATAKTLSALYPDKKITFVYGVLADKDYQQMTQALLPIAKKFIAITPDSPRALPAKDLANYLTKCGANAAFYNSIEEGAKTAINEAGDDDIICALGSTYILKRLSAAIS
ncbi:MAG: bifunctional folylpolyglutamate synthase/dihydrofolate synthase [Defluviitaleaceae bacterium]|nr:bifunctional folylpolyglutamate synthase/dihydrofolate synthase [Defluviitaleaceae bacterium]